jgi:hypothetical protein
LKKSALVPPAVTENDFRFNIHDAGDERSDTRERKQFVNYSEKNIVTYHGARHITVQVIVDDALCGSQRNNPSPRPRFRRDDDGINSRYAESIAAKFAR